MSNTPLSAELDLVDPALRVTQSAMPLSGAVAELVVCVSRSWSSDSPPLAMTHSTVPLSVVLAKNQLLVVPLRPCPCLVLARLVLI